MDEPIQDQPQEPPKKTRGWQKGRKRGPRKPKEAPAPPVQPQTPPNPSPAPPAVPAPPEPTGAYEPITVSARLVSGPTVTFKATDFDVQNGRYAFTSYPATRGFKTVTVLRADQLAMLEVTGPEPMMEKMKYVPATEPQRTYTVPLSPAQERNLQAAQPSGPPIVYGPPLQRPPYDGGDPRRTFKDPRAEYASTIPNAPGIPMAQLSKGENGEPDNTMATMG